MKPRNRDFLILLLILTVVCSSLCSCNHTGNTQSGNEQWGSTPAESSSSPRDTVSPSKESQSTSEAQTADNTQTSENTQPSGEVQTSEETEPETTTTAARDNTPVVLVGSADGNITYGNDSVTIDASHTSDGYIMVSYTGSNPKVKLQITGTNGTTYTYNLHGGYETFPLTSGSGAYTVTIFENIEGTSYSTLFSHDMEVSITNEFGPYLYANQYVNFDASSQAVAKAVELASTADNDLEVIENVYNYIITNFIYDYDKAASVSSGYLPVVDDILSSKTGICFDYSAVMATMLRTQRIPTRLEVGYVGDIYHAWISTYVEGHGWINGIIEFDGKEWKLMDPTSASTSSSPKEYLTKNTYLTKYVY